ncbi:hypothetical protein HK096_010958 [Nowakowskiella sp. JEL0078]|nr:hypothetical protein HK096_010958 [Nowakowskiella sp. JEL0078]
MAAAIEDYVNKFVSILITDGRIIVGTLLGFDQTTNVVLKDSVEREFSENGTNEIPLGVYLVRGDMIAMIGEVDMEKEAQISWREVTATPIATIKQQVI